MDQLTTTMRMTALKPTSGRRSWLSIFRHGFVGALLFSTVASGNMQLDRTQIVFETDGPGREDVIVRNTGEHPLYLKLEVLEVTAPGTEEERREVVENPETIGLIASPTKLVIQPDRRRAIRLVNLRGHGEQERVYRVNVLPVAPPVDAEGIGVRILIAYQLLVFVRPVESRVQLDAERTPEGVRLRNNGNVNVLLRDVQHCPDAAADCSELRGMRLYPGNQRLLEAPAGGHVQFTAVANGRSRRHRY